MERSECDPFGAGCKSRARKPTRNSSPRCARAARAFSTKGRSPTWPRPSWAAIPSGSLSTTSRAHSLRPAPTPRLRAKPQGFKFKPPSPPEWLRGALRRRPTPTARPPSAPAVTPRRTLYRSGGGRSSRGKALAPRGHRLRLDCRTRRSRTEAATRHTRVCRSAASPGAKRPPDEAEHGAAHGAAHEAAHEAMTRLNPLLRSPTVSRTHCACSRPRARLPPNRSPTRLPPKQSSPRTASRGSSSADSRRASSRARCARLGTPCAPRPPASDVAGENGGERTVERIVEWSVERHRHRRAAGIRRAARVSDAPPASRSARLPYTRSRIGSLQVLAVSAAQMARDAAGTPRLQVNGLQSSLFVVLWKLLEDSLGKRGM